MKQSKTITKTFTGDNVTIVRDNPEINIKPIKLQHHKNEVILYDGLLCRCICCDHAFAVYCPIIRIDGYWSTRLESPFVIANTPSENFKYELHHDDFWVMVDQEQKEADSKL